MHPRIPLLISIALAACGGRYHASAPATTVKEAPRGVEAAALPYKILDRSGHEIAEADFWAKLGAARAVCVGEEHPNPHAHWAQLQVIQHLDAGDRGRGFAIGMEMVQRPFQAVLDDYAAKRIDDAALQSRTGWADRWGYDFKLYRPLLRAAIDHGAALVALNASKEMVEKVAHQGLDKLTAEERAQLPELVLDDKAHRAWFDGVMAEMAGDENGPSAHKPEDAAAADRMYSVQVLWDESMADGAVRWLGNDPHKQIVILAGDGHCHDSAIVGRIKRRGVSEVVSVHPIIDDGQGGLAEELATPINDYFFVMSIPAGPASAK